MGKHPLTNTMPGAARRAKNAGAGVEAADAGDLKVAYGAYSFAADGGAVGDISLGVSVPSGAIVVGGLMEVTAALTSGGAATAALKLEGAADLIAQANFDAAPWSSTGRKSLIPAMTGATSIKTTAERALSLTVGAQPLTGGAFGVYLYYLDPTANY